MKRKLIYSAGMLMLLASPIFAQTPGGGGGSDLHLPCAYLAMGIAVRPLRPRTGKSDCRSRGSHGAQPWRAAGIRFALILGLALIESLALYTLVITYIAK